MVTDVLMSYTYLNQTKHRWHFLQIVGAWGPTPWRCSVRSTLNHRPSRPASGHDLTTLSGFQGEISETLKRQAQT